MTGSIFGQHTVTDEIADVRTLLSPLAPEDVRTVRCLGLNYVLHAKETGMALPKYPVLFVRITPCRHSIRAPVFRSNPAQYKPSTSLSGPTDPIPVPAGIQDDAGLDYECELVAVIGRKGVNIAEEDALSYVMGYSVGNDVSHRDWQIKKGGGQWSLGKGFDGWAPWGPGIVSSALIRDPQTLQISTRLNGTTVQDSNTNDMIFSVKQAISFLSKGVTLLPGDVIFTGTPSGVGMGRTPNLWLQDGDVVEVQLEGVGVCTNKVEFDSKSKL